MNRAITALCRRAAIAAAMVVATSLAYSSRAYAQASQGDFQPPKEFTALMTDIGDIGELAALNPLKLTADELDKLITTVKSAEDAYNKQLLDITVPPIRAISDDIKQTRQSLLTSGGGVPKNFDDKVNKIVSDYNARRDQVEADTLKNLAEKIRAILTKEQITVAVGLAKKASAKPDSQPAKGEDDKYFNYYVLATFIVYPHTVPVLEDMKKQAAKSGALPGAARTRLAAAGDGRR